MGELHRRLSARVLKVGKSRVWIDPSKLEDVGKAITATDIRKLIKKNVIRAIPAKAHKTRELVKHKKGPGKKKGTKYSIVTRKERWINTVRPLRSMLNELKEDKKIDNKTYRNLRGLVKGGMFRSRAHLKIYLEQHGILKE